MEIRDARVDDVAAVERVATAAWHEAHAPIAGEAAVEQFLSKYYDGDRLREYVADPSQSLVVADDNGIVGFALVTPYDEEPGVFTLGSIYVHPDRWGEGVGTRLLVRIEDVTRERGGSRLRLGVMAENDRAVGFYESHGYERHDEGYDERLGVEQYTYARDL